MNKSFVLLPFLLSLILFVGCLPKDKNEKEVKIIEQQIGGKTYYVPNIYLKMSSGSLSDDGGLIQAFYPGNIPILGDPKELWKQGEWYKNIRILFEPLGQWNSKNVLGGHLKAVRAYKEVGKEYNLTHFSQNESDQSFREDVWVESNSDNYISCSEKTDEDDPVSLCKYYFYENNMKFKVTFDKTFLPEWQLIKSNVLSLMQSFENPESARNHIKKYDIYNK